MSILHGRNFTMMNNSLSMCIGEFLPLGFSDFKERKVYHDLEVYTPYDKLYKLHDLLYTGDRKITIINGLDIEKEYYTFKVKEVFYSEPNYKNILSSFDVTIDKGICVDIILYDEFCDYTYTHIYT